MFSVPPLLGVPADALADADPDDDVDEELHAASPAVASTATASVVRRFGALIMGMFLLVNRTPIVKAAVGAPILLITAYLERLCVSAAEIQTNAAVVAGL